MSRPHLKRTTAPEALPINIEEAAEHCRIDSDDELPYLKQLIEVASEYVEKVTGRVAVASTFTLVAPSWHSLINGDDNEPRIDCRNPYSIPIPRAPLNSVSSIKYYASNSESQTTISSSDYRVITSRDPGIVQFIDSPPSVEDRLDAIEIIFAAGSSDPTDAPPVLRHAVKMIIAHLYKNREHVNIGNIVSRIPDTVPMMLEHEKISGWIA